MKRHDPLRVDAIIRQAITAAGADESYERARASFLWSEVVGPTVNRYTVRRWIQQDELHVVSASAALKNELSFSKERIVHHINQLVGKNVISKLVIH